VENGNASDDKVWTFETEPVDDLNSAISAFVVAYDNLQKLLHAELPETVEEFRRAMYRPVMLLDERGAISLYEIGVTRSPDSSIAGKYSINMEKLQEAFSAREADIQLLFTQAEVGLLVRLREMLTSFTDSEDLSEDIYNAAMRFLNECRRLHVMWD